MPVTVAELAPIKNLSPYLHECLVKIINEVNLTQKSTGVAAPGRLPSPSTIAGITVTSANGIFDIAIQDPDVAQPGTVYFLEYSTSPNFPGNATHVRGPNVGRNFSGLFLGSATYYFRAYSGYIGSTVTSPIIVYGGTAPIGVAGGGTLAAPALSAGQGSGTSQVPGFGFGPPANQIVGKQKQLQ